MVVKQVKGKLLPEILRLRHCLVRGWINRSNIIEAIEHESKTSIFQLLVELGGNGDGRASLLKNWFCPSYLSSFDSSQVSQAHFDLSSIGTF